MEKIDTNKIDRWTLLELENYLNIKPRDFKLLMEAYRRKNVLKDQKTFDYPFLGQGLPSQYKNCRFFTPHGGKETPKVVNWYRLTKSGEEVLKTIEQILPIPTDTKIKNKLNEILYTF